MKTAGSEKFRITLARHLESIRQKKGITYPEIAEMTGLGKPTIENIFNAVFSPKIDAVYLIAKAMDALDEIFAFPEEK
jgi:transcriptional regulator with XRE-family HTH domain